ncbi:MAG: hypothetical protein MJ072_04795 [Clostridia bacterium]|nr:hypothetical protein [Clostridia bacterium]
MNERVFNHQLDAKNRMRLPSKLRERFSDGYVIMRWADDCLRVVPIAEYNKLTEDMKKVSAFNIAAQKTIDKMMYYSWEAVEDQQGRILIPEYIRNKVGFNKNLIILDSLSGVKIWAEEVWAKYVDDDNTESFNASITELGNLMNLG